MDEESSKRFRELESDIGAMRHDLKVEFDKIHRELDVLKLSIKNKSC